MTAEDILEKLVSFRSVVGTANADIVGFVKETAKAAGAKVIVLPGAEGDRANLFATIGPESASGYVLSGHMDVVPADEGDWQSDPFRMRRDGERLYGRGTSDMKGFLACALAAFPGLAKQRLQKPIHLAFSYDEEAGCRGVPHLIAALPALCAPPIACIVGEPSGMTAIRSHKGKAAIRITLTGRAGHSSRPDTGLNAIHAMNEVLQAAIRQSELIAQGPLNRDFIPPHSTLQVGTIAGGTALNVIPDRCSIDLEVRAVPGISAASLLVPVEGAAEQLRAKGFGVSVEILSEYPAMSLGQDEPLARLLEDLTGRPSIAAVSYGTEAGLFQEAGIPSIICGPGDIARAHRSNEYIEKSELQACSAMIAALAERINA